MVEIGPRKGAYSLQTELKWEQLILNYEGHVRGQINELEFGDEEAASESLIRKGKIMCSVLSDSS